MGSEEKKEALEAGRIAKRVKEYIRSFIKPNMPLTEIAWEVEKKIMDFGARPAFPTNLSIDEIAAHYTPSFDDPTLCHGLLKIDLGVQVNGWIADTAFSIDFDKTYENQQLIEAAELALKRAIRKMGRGTPLGMIGQEIQMTIEGKGLSPITNLSGHEMKQYQLHAGLVIPNSDNKMTDKLGEGLYAVEPFATNGSGKVIEGKPSGIYILINDKNTRSRDARELMSFILEEYKTLPFCSRWIIEKFGNKALIALKELEKSKNIHQYPQLIEASKGKVSQAEETVLVQRRAIVTTG